MKNFAYPEMYVDNAADVLGTMFDYAINSCNFTADEFAKMFISSGVAKDFSYGSTKYILGMSGRELCNYINYVLKGQEIIDSFSSDDILNKSPEYWAGWILAKYQWYSCQSFDCIFNAINFSDLIRMYHPLHEAPEDKTFEILDQKLLSKNIPLFNRFNENFEPEPVMIFVNPTYTNLYRSDDYKISPPNMSLKSSGFSIPDR